MFRTMDQHQVIAVDNGGDEYKIDYDEKNKRLKQYNSKRQKQYTSTRVSRLRDPLSTITSNDDDNVNADDDVAGETKHSSIRMRLTSNNISNDDDNDDNNNNNNNQLFIPLHQCIAELARIPLKNHQTNKSLQNIIESVGFTIETPIHESSSSSEEDDEINATFTGKSIDKTRKRMDEIFNDKARSLIVCYRIFASKMEFINAIWRAFDEEEEIHNMNMRYAKDDAFYADLTLKLNPQSNNQQREQINNELDDLQIFYIRIMGFIRIWLMFYSEDFNLCQSSDFTLLMNQRFTQLIDHPTTSQLLWIPIIIPQLQTNLNKALNYSTIGNNDDDENMNNINAENQIINMKDEYSSFTPQQFAQQLTIYTFQLIADVPIEEILEIGNDQLKLNRLYKFFNDLTNWTIREIQSGGLLGRLLTNYEKNTKKSLFVQFKHVFQRIKSFDRQMSAYQLDRLKYMIDMIIELWRLNNCSIMVVIYNGLMNQQVRCLSDVWDGVGARQLRQLILLKQTLKMGLGNRHFRIRASSPSIPLVKELCDKVHFLLQDKRLSNHINDDDGSICVSLDSIRMLYRIYIVWEQCKFAPYTHLIRIPTIQNALKYVQLFNMP